MLVDRGPDDAGHGGLRPAGWAAMAVLVLLLGACGGGSSQQQPTAAQVGALASKHASGSAGSVMVREAWIPPPAGRSYPPGSGVYLQLILLNRGSSWDSLTSVTTPVAPRVSLSVYNIDQDFISLPNEPQETDASAQLQDTTETITPGESVPVTFQFRSAGSLTLDVPVDTAPTPPKSSS